jgi:hypothetical protein
MPGTREKKNAIEARRSSVVVEADPASHKQANAQPEHHRYGHPRHVAAACAQYVPPCAVNASARTQPQCPRNGALCTSVAARMPEAGELPADSRQ